MNSLKDGGEKAPGPESGARDYPPGTQVVYTFDIALWKTRKLHAYQTADARGSRAWKFIFSDGSESDVDYYYGEDFVFTEMEALEYLANELHTCLRELRDADAKIQERLMVLYKSTTPVSVTELRDAVKEAVTRGGISGGGISGGALSGGALSGGAAGGGVAGGGVRG